MKILKRDFVENNIRSIDNRALPSGKAYFIQDESGNISYASKDRVKLDFPDTDIRTIIDLTNGLIKIYNHNGGGGGNGGNRERPLDLGTIELNKAIKYLMYTQEKLGNFSGYNSNNFLRSVYDYYIINNTLSQRQVEVVLGIEQQIPKYSLLNLDTCYAYEYKIKRSIAVLANNTPGIEYMESMLNQLYAKLYLSENQINGIKKWFEFLTEDLRNTELTPFYV